MKRFVVVGLVLMGQVLGGQPAHSEREGGEKQRTLKAEQLLAVRHALEQNPAFIARLALSYKRALQKEQAAQQEADREVKKRVEQITAPLEQLMAAIKAQKSLGGEICAQLFVPEKSEEKTDKTPVATRSAMIQDYLSNQAQGAAAALQEKIMTAAQYQQFCQEMATLCRALLQALSPQGREKYVAFMGKLKESDYEGELSGDLLADLQMLQSGQDAASEQQDPAQIPSEHQAPAPEPLQSPDQSPHG